MGYHVTSSTAILDHLSQRGLKKTAARLAVVRVLADTDHLLTPRQIYTEAAVQAPAVSLATVYRTLDALCGAGLAQRIDAAGDEGLYILCASDHHHHVICTRCRRVLDLSTCTLAGMETVIAQATGFTIQRHSLEFFGFCQTCQAEMTPRGGTP